MIITTTLKLSQNIEREEILLNSVCKISITLDPKQGTQEKNYIPIPLGTAIQKFSTILTNSPAH